MALPPYEPWVLRTARRSPGTTHPPRAQRPPRRGPPPLVPSAAAGARRPPSPSRGAARPRGGAGERLDAERRGAAARSSPPLPPCGPDPPAVEPTAPPLPQRRQPAVASLRPRPSRVDAERLAVHGSTAGTVRQEPLRQPRARPRARTHETERWMRRGGGPHARHGPASAATCSSAAEPAREAVVRGGRARARPPRVRRALTPGAADVLTRRDRTGHAVGRRRPPGERCAPGLARPALRCAQRCTRSPALPTLQLPAMRPQGPGGVPPGPGAAGPPRGARVPAPCGPTPDGPAPRTAVPGVALAPARRAVQRPRPDGHHPVARRVDYPNDTRAPAAVPAVHLVQPHHRAPASPAAGWRGCVPSRRWARRRRLCRRPPPRPPGAAAVSWCRPAGRCGGPPARLVGRAGPATGPRPGAATGWGSAVGGPWRRRRSTAHLPAQAGAVSKVSSAQRYHLHRG
jgi:hypothetical protein